MDLKRYSPTPCILTLFMDSPQNETPIVSVIIPTYNRIDFLMEAIASVQEQRYRPIELIVVDDGSTDGTTERLSGVCDVHVLQISHTGRPGAVRNTGIDAATGDYIAFLDSDDLWHRYKLTLQMEALAANPDSMIIHCREIWIRDGRIVSQASQRHRRSGWIFADAVRKCIIGPSTVLLHRSILDEVGGFREDLEIAEDYELWLRVTHRFPVAYCDQPLVTKRAGHGDQISERYEQIERFRIDALEPLVSADHWQGLERSIARRELERKCRIYAAGARKRERNEEAAHYESLARNASISADSSGS